MAEIESKSNIWDDDELGDEFASLSDEELRQRIQGINQEARLFNSEINRLLHDERKELQLVTQNQKSIDLHKQLPYLVSNVVEIVDIPREGESEDGSAMELDQQLTNKGVVIKTTTRNTVFLPMVGLVPPSELRPGELVGVNKDNYLILDKLPTEFDSRVKAMELDEKPSETTNDIGGLDKQIQELVEAVVLPMTHAESFKKIGIMPPKGCLLHGPPGTGKTLLARAIANKSDAIFLKLAGPQLVQMYIGDGAKMIRDAFELAKEKISKTGAKGAIIFIDELDAIGSKRFDSDHSSDREVQRTMLELLNQMDGFSSDERIKVIGATNRPDILDPALMRSGRLDRKVELPHPDESSRKRIMQIHSRNMNVDKGDVNFEELSRCTEDFNGAQLKAVSIR
eukprot:TRINITY_DN864_c0_g1_i1.p1 TRINITY_DN864_c0_g1~~TRINITY_DN864_c0_g1_i1.p1  ORF type:complete len:397 (+),score=130.03 TRINITY_DN864_c0_g1_i1:86-1276(+)